MASSTDTTGTPLYEYVADKIMVSKVSGSVPDDEETLRNILSTQKKMIEHNAQCALVHGGGLQLSARFPNRRQHPRTGLYVTESEHVPVMLQEIVAIGRKIADMCKEIGLPCQVFPYTVTKAKKMEGHGRTGEALHMDENQRNEILKTMQGGILPVIPFGGEELPPEWQQETDSQDQKDPKETFLNVNADHAAAMVGSELGAAKLIQMTNEDGILLPGNNGTMRLRSYLCRADLLEALQAMKSDGTPAITKGMRVKVDAIIAALMGGVPQVHVVRAQQRSVMTELLTKTGCGTLIESNSFHTFEHPAHEDHLPDITTLLTEARKYTIPKTNIPYLKPRTEGEVRKQLPKTIIMRHRNTVVGTASYETLNDDPDTAVISNFVISDDHPNSGYGRRLLVAMLEAIENKKFVRAISFTANPALKTLYNQYCRKHTADWEAERKKRTDRYGRHGNQLEVFEFAPDAYLELA